jgi:hypothetical protein
LTTHQPQPDFPTCQDMDRRAIAHPARSWGVFFSLSDRKSPVPGSRHCSPILANARQIRAIIESGHGPFLPIS